MRAESLPFLVGGGALAAHVWSRSRTGAPTLRALPDAPSIEPPDILPPHVTTRPAAPATTAQLHSSLAPSVLPPLPGRWVWPLPIWRGRRPDVSDGFGSPRPGGARHEGVDLMFPRVPSDPYRSGTPNGSSHYVMPDDMVALAAADGVIWSAGWTARGYSVVIDHAPLAPFATYYTHLSGLRVAPTQGAKSGDRIRAGQPIGIVGADPLDDAHLKHLHFALWRGGAKDAIDPLPLMHGWPYVNDPREGLRDAAPLVYRPVGDRGEDYPWWVRELKGKSGAYVIRQRRGDEAEVVYVGQSSGGALYETLTRHFQIWRRWKGFWRGQYGEGHDPGMTYERSSVDVAVRVLPASRALDEEARLIRRLRPRDNLIGQPAQLEDAPF